MVRKIAKTPDESEYWQIKFPLQLMQLGRLMQLGVMQLGQDDVAIVKVLAGAFFGSRNTLAGGSLAARVAPR